jgi:hypothetical protein
MSAERLPLSAVKEEKKKNPTFLEMAVNEEKSCIPRNV